LAAWSVDLGVTHWSTSSASINDAVEAPSFTFANIGARYRFHILNAPATLRLQVSNLTNANIWSIGYSPGFFQYPPRAYLGYITVDL
jgi:TonB dependent receptor